MSEDNDSQQIPDVAKEIFGDRLGLAIAYRDILAGDGITQGLIGPREHDRLWDRHILNCAVIGEQIGEGQTVVDIGSGAGLPGIVLSIARPDLDIVLVEPLLRRSTFLEKAVYELGIEVRVIRGRAEDAAVRSVTDGVDVVTSRAVAPLAKLAKWSAPLIKPGGRLLAIKGATAQDEIDRDAAAVSRTGIGELRVESYGLDLLPSPTIVISGVRHDRGNSAARASRRRARGGR